MTQTTLNSITQVLCDLAHTPNDFDLDTKILEHGLWTSNTLTDYVARLWTKQAFSESMKPNLLLPLIVACKGYSFNHVTTRVNSDDILYCWERLDTILITLQTRRSAYGSILEKFMDSRSPVGYRSSMGLFLNHDQRTGLISPPGDSNMYSTFKALLDTEMRIKSVEFPKLTYDTMCHLTIDRKVRGFLGSWS